MHLTRALMLEVLRQDYIRTTWSKGHAGTACHPQTRLQECGDPGHHLNRYPDHTDCRRHGSEGEQNREILIRLPRPSATAVQDKMPTRWCPPAGRAADRWHHPSGG